MNISNSRACTFCGFTFLCSSFQSLIVAFLDISCSGFHHSFMKFNNLLNLSRYLVNANYLFRASHVSEQLYMKVSLGQRNRVVTAFLSYFQERETSSLFFYNTNYVM